MIRVAVVDGDGVARAGVCGMLRTSERIDVVAEAGDGRRGMEITRWHRPDVLLTEVRLPEADGIRITHLVQRELPDTKVVMLTTITQDECVYRSFRAGAAGFLVKDVGPGELVDAVLKVASGEQVLSPAITREVISQFLRFDRDNARRARAQIETLTNREREVLGHVVRGGGNAQIARALYLSEGAVKAHVSRIIGKMRCTNRVQVAIKAHESGLFAA